MATKREMAQELIELGATDKSIKELMDENTAKQLESMLDEYKVEDVTEVEAQPTAPQIDMEALKAQMMAELEAKIRAEMEAQMKAEADSAPSEAPVEAPVKRVTEIDRHKLVPLMNVTPHGLVYQSRRSGMEVEWAEYGDIEWIEMQEILTMRSSQRKFLDEPFVLVMDDEVVSYLGLEKMYEKMIEPDNIDKVFKMNLQRFKEVIDESPRGIQILIVNRARKLIETGEFDSGQKINYINEKFNTDLRVV